MEARIAGLVVEVRTRQTKQGKTMGFATLDDKTGRLECAVFGDVYEKYRSIFTRDSLLIALRLTVEKLYDIDQARESFSRGLKLTWNVAENKPESINYIERLSEALAPFKGGSCPVSINYTSQHAQAAVQLGDEWRIHPTDELISRLKSLFGSTSVEVRYK